ncbi:hypothetical protein FGG08_004676 [Glutinoglossum americanum]|uniref:Uncharacterized protein n=1 Tax=Glutinoglossum americanum TaxID=1670608 RepID=A0A9P8L3N6_9PEZI|nr:hypothetical protein FGG08_004676 [Glutinoglossum americanum]
MPPVHGECDAEIKNRAFSNVVTDPQFSAIGLVLMAILARLNRIICAQSLDESHTPDRALEPRVDEDLGEAVTRDVREDQSQGMNTVSDDANSKILGVAAYGEGIKQLVEVPLASRMPSLKPKRKKRKTGNAIDDLFNTIL